MVLKLGGRVCEFPRTPEARFPWLTAERESVCVYEGGGQRRRYAEADVRRQLRSIQRPKGRERREIECCCFSSVERSSEETQPPWLRDVVCRSTTSEKAEATRYRAQRRWTSDRNESEHRSELISLHFQTDKTSEPKRRLGDFRLGISVRKSPTQQVRITSALLHS